MSVKSVCTETWLWLLSAVQKIDLKALDQLTRPYTMHLRQRELTSKKHSVTSLSCLSQQHNTLALSLLPCEHCWKLRLVWVKRRAEFKECADTIDTKRRVLPQLNTPLCAAPTTCLFNKHTKCTLPTYLWVIWFKNCSCYSLGCFYVSNV